MKDILLNTDLDLQFSNGDLVIGESTKQHQELLMLSKKGDWKENPTIGIGAPGFLKDEDYDGLLAEIKKEFERDGMVVRSVSYDNEKLNVDAYYP